MFFEEENTGHLLNTFHELSNLEPEEFKNRYIVFGPPIEYLYQLFQDIHLLIENIIKEPKVWDSLCYTSINFCGTEFIHNLQILSEDRGVHSGHAFDSIIEKTYINCLFFIHERDFNTPPNSIEESNYKNNEITKIHNNLTKLLLEPKLSPQFKNNICEIKSKLSFSLMKKVYHSEIVSNYISFEEKNKKVEQILSEIDNKSNEINNNIKNQNETIYEKENRVEELLNSLNKYEIAFNFVGLYKGFNNLAKRKEKESTNSFIFLVVLSFLLMIFPIYGMVTVYSPSSEINKYTPFTHLLAFLPLISLELILIYFFRVVLHNYKSVQAQILQIELRQTLCQFIQNYADYSKEIRKDDPTALEKFENLIFSGIISDAQNLPSTFDGMDQIGKLLSSLKSK